MEHRPVLHIYQDGDKFFAALSDFVDLQQSPVVWLSEEDTQRLRLAISDLAHEQYGGEKPKP